MGYDARFPSMLHVTRRSVFQALGFMISRRDSHACGFMISALPDKALSHSERQILTTTNHEPFRQVDILVNRWVIRTSVPSQVPNNVAVKRPITIPLPSNSKGFTTKPKIDISISRARVFLPPPMLSIRIAGNGHRKLVVVAIKHATSNCR